MKINFKKILFYLYSFTLFILYIQSLHAWFFWEKHVQIIVLTAFVSFIFYIFNKNDFNFSKNNYIIALILLLAEIYLNKESGIGSILSALLRSFILSFVIFLNDDKKILVIKIFTRLFAIILFFSMAGWLLFHLGISLPYETITTNDGKYSFNNYYLFLNNITLIFPRFSAIFLEPGHLGLITSFLLYVNNFNLKKISVMIILVATIITFSLAAYILLFFAFFAYTLFLSKKPILYFITISIVSASFYLFFKNYNNGDNLVNILILERSKIEDGKLSGYNRTVISFDNYFKKFSNSPQLIWGEGSEKYNKMIWESGNAGIKVFILFYGIMGFLLVFLLYFFLALSYQSKMGWFLFFIYLLSFFRSTYPLWECIILTYITALTYVKQFEINKLNKND